MIHRHAPFTFIDLYIHILLVTFFLIQQFCFIREIRVPFPKMELIKRLFNFQPTHYPRPSALLIRLLQQSKKDMATRGG